jgi:hypothetical protein
MEMGMKKYDKANDAAIREAVRSAKDDRSLPALEAMTGITVADLRKIASGAEISHAQRIILNGFLSVL